MARLDTAALRGLITRIEAGLAPRADCNALIDALQDEGATIRFAGGTHQARIAGLQVTCTEGFAGALRAWCRKARAELAKEGV